jgi:serine/threonine protein kinase
MVTQTFNVSRSFAPEIESGQAHDTAADIWALGQVCYQLLCCIDQDENLKLGQTANLAVEEEV